MRTICPVCGESVHIAKKEEGKIIACQKCDSSLFIVKIENKIVKCLPFQIVDPTEKVFSNEYTDSGYEEDFD